jgi:hypothetical protein
MDNFDELEIIFESILFLKQFDATQNPFNRYKFT